MKNLINLFLLCVIISAFTSCGKDDKGSTCEGLLNNGGTMEVDGVSLNLTVAQLLISSGFEGDNYQFQVGGLTSDCSDLKTLGFFVELPKNSDFDGTYDIVDFFGSSLNDVTGVNVTSSNLSAGQQSLVEVGSGTMVVQKLADKEYQVVMTGNLVGGGTTEIEFKSKF